MLFPSIVAALAALANPVLSLTIPQATGSELDVQLSAIGNTRIKAVITNKADRQLKLLKYNNFFDDGPIQKAGVFKDGQPVKFEGMLRRVLMKNLEPSLFVSLSPGQTVEREFDIASTADLASGGAYTVFSQGAIPFAEGDGTTIAGAVAFKSNKLDLDIDGALAATVSKAINPISARTRVESACRGEQRETLLKALEYSAQLSRAAAQAAQNNTRKVEEYFMKSDAQTVETIVARLNAVAQESSSTDSGATRYFCNDRGNQCTPNTIAYTLPSLNVVVNCPIYYDLPVISDECHAQDQATTCLHEFTHNPGVYDPYCRDHAYGYDGIRKLSPEQALLNADTYSLFANAIYVNC
ncbi:metalloproteinase 8 [Coccidioides immitis RS]|uniref:Neutral protease 2 n=5 Tax=Coccidioides TaxID=5500 RepID=J3KA57_COCIM|nr:metalloproteinase 8 [Coccidioides immitis RS]KMM68388.1 neutral protease 2 [Coccidioides posadasii RMSCC 3488]KMP02475.1 neutral protease 2 [Coccidioides immitis RMSCC 2394]KMU76742.1 neutral protease 2 [Coccidioides immitis RMSCC 3703]KMU88819.1 neutral protease 2 [Coccidioides immitis H538.4]TPX24552.1 ammonium transporter [Coccidioides immitis]